MKQKKQPVKIIRHRASNPHPTDKKFEKLNNLNIEQTEILKNLVNDVTAKIDEFKQLNSRKQAPVIEPSFEAKIDELYQLNLRQINLIESLIASKNAEIVNKPKQKSWLTRIFSRQ